MALIIVSLQWTDAFLLVSLPTFSRIRSLSSTSSFFRAINRTWPVHLTRTSFCASALPGPLGYHLAHTLLHDPPLRLLIMWVGFLLHPPPCVPPCR